ncbi:MAG: outer membrane beta-barrel protein [Gemmatimonadales bacterium]|jgi:hypothetical protein
MLIARFTRVLVAIGLALAFAGPSVAQDLRAGLRFGVDFADLGGDAENTSVKTGFSAGAFIGADLGTIFRLGIDGQYVQKGAKAEETDLDDLEFNLEYLEFLLPLSVTVPTQGSLTPRFFAGPALAFETSCKRAATVDGVDVGVDCDEQDVDGATKGVDFGVFFGLGADVTLGTGVMAFDVLYNLGLSDINDVAGSENTLKNRNIQITIGYALVVGGS